MTPQSDITLVTAKPRRLRAEGTVEPGIAPRLLRVISMALRAMLALVLGLGLWSCADNGHDDEPPMPPEEPAMAQLTIRVGALRGAGPLSRSEDDQFEPPVYTHENIRSLRIIIERPAGTIEHNVVLTFPGGTPERISHTLKVYPSERKKVYLIANEPSALSGSLDQIGREGGQSSASIADMRLTRYNDNALYDNTGNRPTWIAMSEQFDVDVLGIEENGGSPYQTADLFITRAAVKFSFTFTPAAGYDGDGIEITDIRLDGIASTEYLLPRATVYNPDKNLPSSNPLEGRWITSYVVPPANQYPLGSYQYHPSAALLAVAGNGVTYSPAIYLPESPPGNYRLSLRVHEKNSSEAPQWVGPVTLDDLKDLPRNTHVYIRATVTTSRLAAAVTIEPFKGTDLNPGFGFD